MGVKTQIEIEATPEEVRKIFLDFEHWHEIKSDMIRSVTRVPPTVTGPVQKGDKLAVNFSGITSQVTVLENSPGHFSWRGDMLYVLSGIHSFRFEESKSNKGWTMFRNDEEPARLNILLMRLLPAEKLFQQFCVDFKKRVDSVKAEGAASTGTGHA